MADDKNFDLMTQMYAEMKGIQSEMRDGFKKVDERFDKVDDRFGRLENIVTRMENEHGQKLQILFDATVQQNEKLDGIEDRLVITEDKIDSLTLMVKSHDLKIKVIEGGKRKAK